MILFTLRRRPSHTCLHHTCTAQNRRFHRHALRRERAAAVSAHASAAAAVSPPPLLAGAVQPPLVPCAPRFAAVPLVLLVFARFVPILLCVLRFVQRGAAAAQLDVQSFAYGASSVVHSVFSHATLVMGFVAVAAPDLGAPLARAAIVAVARRVCGAVAGARAHARCVPPSFVRCGAVVGGRVLRACHRRHRRRHHRRRCSQHGERSWRRPSPHAALHLVRARLRHRVAETLSDDKLTAKWARANDIKVPRARAHTYIQTRARRIRCSRAAHTAHTTDVAWRFDDPRRPRLPQ